MVFLLGGAAFAEEPPHTMTSLVERRQRPDIPEESFAAQPRVIYRAGNRYCRSEEWPDREHGIHGLMIINEPDTWLINLFTKTGRHILDPGPTFNCRMPIFIGAGDIKSVEDLKNPLYELEYGRELAYFKGKGSVAKDGPVLQGRQTNAYAVTAGQWQLLLFTSGRPERPVALIRDDGKTRDTIWYGTYEELPFDPKLFVIPEGLKIEEDKQ